MYTKKTSSSDRQVNKPEVNNQFYKLRMANQADARDKIQNRTDTVSKFILLLP